MRLRLAAWCLLALLLIGLAGSWLFGSLVSRPANAAIERPPAPARTISLTAADGTPIEGSHWPGAQPDAPAVLLLHGIDGSRLQMLRHALWLNGLGYAVLAIDFRGHGRSGAVARSFGLEEARDAEAALAFLRSGRPDRPVGVIGISLGGAAALLGDTGPLPVQAMVLQAVYPDLRTAIANRIGRIAGWPIAAVGEPLLSYQSLPRFGVSPARIAPRDRIARLRCPVLIIGGTADRSTIVANSRALFAAAPRQKALWLVDGADHEAISTLWSADYRNRVRTLFARTLGEPR
jgi:pimeloyl-ACP methyl ester carboxylesterase